jgi:hypothetical protein
MNFVKFFILLTGARVSARSPATMRRVRMVCWWMTMVTLTIAACLAYVAWGHLGHHGKFEDAISIASFLALLVFLSLAGWASLGWVYFAFIGWIARAE